MPFLFTTKCEESRGPSVVAPICGPFFYVHQQTIIDLPTHLTQGVAKKVHYAETYVCSILNVRPKIKSEFQNS